MSFVQSMQDYKNKKGNMIFHSVSLENGNYTTIQNSVLLNINLSDKAVRVFGLMLMHRFNPSFQMNNFFLANALNCDIKTIQRSCKELKTLGYLDIYPTGEMRGNAPVYEYEIYENPIVNLEVADKGSGQRQQTKPAVKNVLLNKNINKNIKKKVSKEDETYQLSEIENVENSIIEFADKADEDKIRNEFDNLLDGRLEIQSNLIDALKKKSSDFRKVRPVAETIELIKLLPEFVKSSKLKNTDKTYKDKQSLTYLVKILENPLGNYPKWFLDSQKQEVVNNKVADMETVWKQTVKIWDCHYAGRIDDCIKKMVEKILNFVIESENYKKAGKPDNVFLSRFRGVFNQSCTNTLEVKKLSEMIEIINEYINKSWNKSDVFCEVIENFTKNGYSLETIESYFLQNKAGV